MLFIRKDKLQKNNEIKDKEIRVIDSNGSMLGVLPTHEAQQIADSKDLDLIKIVPNAVPPVCKIVDYQKDIYERAKKEKEAKKNQKVVSLKEIRLSVKIDTHDFDFKMRNANKFLKEGNKVKASIRFKGREQKSALLGKEVLTKFAEALKEIGEIERQPYLEGRSMTMILCPKK